jgi:PAS domain-containing protein
MTKLVSKKKARKIGNSRIHSQKGITLKEMRDFLDNRPHAVWYTRYQGGSEFVEYANQEFAKAFGLTVDKVLKKKKYKAINPPGAPVQRYKKEDRIAMKKGIILLRGSDPAITVVKVRFVDGILGMFILAADTRKVSLDSLEPELIETLSWVKKH